MNGRDSGAAAIRKNEEMAAVLLGGAEPGGTAGARFGSFCAEVRMARSNEDPCAVAACHVALNLLTRFLARVQYRGPVGPLGGLDKPQRRRVDKNGLGKAKMTLVIGDEKPAPGSEALYIGSAGWSSYLSTSRPCTWRPASPCNPLGAMMAGALAAGEVFKRLFADAVPEPIAHVEYDLATHGAAKRHPVLAPDVPAVVDLRRMALVGCGAIGQAVCFALAPFPLSGHLTLIDHDKVDESNLQRYILASKNTVGWPKASLLEAYLRQSSPILQCLPVQGTLEYFAACHGSAVEFDTIVVCVDNVPTRINVQGMLPRVVWNGWTDVSRHSLRYGVSRHAISGRYACIGCYYHPEGPEPTAMDMNAALTGLPRGEIRRLLDGNAVCTTALVRRVSEKSGIALDALRPSIGRPFRDLLHGECGVFALGGGEGAATAPAPHQPLMAGIHIAAQLILSRCKAAPGSITRIESISSFDAMKIPRPGCLFKAAKDSRCFCTDRDYIDAYKAKWRSGGQGARGRRARSTRTGRNAKHPQKRRA